MTASTALPTGYQHSREDLVAPAPRRVPRFVTTLHDDDHTMGRPDPVRLRSAADVGLADLLHRS
ncbi:hypothetical protein [Amycolatopsis sp. NPDC098790]|uniref:hypothetical protein n=1 Tax=Amycolatopsis sp. NPDC098790 TaxID=3363939 RepID=UPI0038124648